MLLRDWEIFKAQRKRYQRSFDEGYVLWWCITLLLCYSAHLCACHNFQIFYLCRIELDRHSSVVENGSDVEEGQDMVVCPSCNRVQSCPCDECCLAHLFSCPAHQPAMRTDYRYKLNNSYCWLNVTTNLWCGFPAMSLVNIITGESLNECGKLPLVENELYINLWFFTPPVLMDPE